MNWDAFLIWVLAKIVYLCIFVNLHVWDFLGGGVDPLLINIVVFTEILVI